MKLIGRLSKMDTKIGITVGYGLWFQNEYLDLTTLIGREIKISYDGKIFCSNCMKRIKKSYAEGVCYPCTMKLASCDLCILKPETCHYDKGTCREPRWGEENCFQPHYIYLANSSGLKVGITRKTNVPFRWMDQGAIEALPVIEVKNRLVSGQIEVLFKKHIADKTDWRKMLKGGTEFVNLLEWKETLLERLKEDLKSFDHKILQEEVLQINYPVMKYPEKINSFNLDKVSEITGKLMGIKGQYLILDTGVFNVRSHSGYEITLEDVDATATT